MTIRNRKIAKVRFDKSNTDAPTINRALDNIIDNLNPFMEDTVTAINNGIGGNITINPQGAPSVSGNNFTFLGANGITYSSNGSNTVTISQTATPTSVSLNVSGASTLTGADFNISGANGVTFTTPNSNTIVISQSTSSAGSLTLNANTGSITANPINLLGAGCCLHTETSGSDTIIISSSAPCNFEGSTNISVITPQTTVISGAHPNTVLLGHFDTNVGTFPAVFNDYGQVGAEHGSSQPIWGSFGGTTLDTTTYKFGGGSAGVNGSTQGPVSAYLAGLTSSVGGNYLANVDGTSGDFTLECWFYPTSTTTYGFQNLMGITKYGTTAATWGFGLYIYLGQLAWCDPANPAGVSTGVTLTTPNVWYAIAVCRKSNVTRIYVDGVLVYTVTNADFKTDNNFLMLGQSPYGYYTHVLQGLLDECRFSNVALYTGSTYQTQSAEFPSFSGVPVTYTDYCSRQFFITGTVPSASHALNADNAITASYAVNAANATTASYALTAATASYLSSLSGDVSGSSNNTTVTKWQNLPVANVSGTVANGEVYTWNTTINKWATYQGSTTADYSVIVQLPLSGTSGSTTITDIAPVAYPVTAYGNAAITTAQEKWAGSGSAYFDGVGDYLAAAANPALQWGTGDWTTEFWLNPDAGYGSGGFSVYAGGLVDYRSSGGSPGFLIMIRTTGEITIWWAGSPALLTSATSIPTGSWTNVVCQRRSGYLEIYVNGTLDASVNIGSSYNQTDDQFTVGSVVDRTSYGFLQYNGYMSDLRISNVARYTGSFTAPTAPYPNPNLTTATPNIGGDISGTLNAITVTGIQGNPVTGGLPSDGDILVWNSGSNIWNHQNTRWYGSFCDLTTQTASNTTTAYPMQLGTTEEALGVSIVSGSQITFAHAGTYNIQFSAQLVKNNASAADVDIWLSETGSNVPRSNTNVHIVGNNAATVAAWNFVRTFPSGSYAEIMWRTSDTDVQLLYQNSGSSPTRPEIPSVIVTVSQI